MLRQWDLLLCVILGMLGAYAALSDFHSPVRQLIGLLVVLVVPGYLLLVVTHPSARLGFLLRLGYSMAISLAEVGVIVFFVSFARLRIDIPDVARSVLAVTLVSSLVALGQRLRVSAFPSSPWTVVRRFLEGRPFIPLTRRSWTVLIALALVAAAVFLTDVVPTGSVGRTEFYMLGPPSSPASLPTSIGVNQTGVMQWTVRCYEDTSTNYLLRVQLSTVPGLDLSRPSESVDWTGILVFSNGSTYADSFPLNPQGNRTQLVSFRITSPGQFYLVFQLDRDVSQSQPLLLVLNVTAHL